MMRLWQAISLTLLLCGSMSCSSGPDVVVVPDDHVVGPVYNAQGELQEGYVALSKGYLKEIMDTLEACK